MSENPGTSISNTAAVAPRRRLSEITCVVGAIAAVAIGTVTLGGAPATMPMLASLLAWIWSAMLATAAVCAIVLAHTPWTAVFDILAGICLYCLCRVLRARARRRAYLVSFVTLAVAWVLYACVQPADSDVQIEWLKALVIGIALAAPGAWWFMRAPRDSRGNPVRASDRGMSAAEEWAWVGVGGFTVVAFVLSCVMGLAHLLDSTNTMPDVTQQVQAKYGAELDQLGFEDVNRVDIVDDDHNSCKSLNVVFHEGVQPGVTPPPLTDVFLHYEGDEYNSPMPACIGMRFREGKLTMAFPDAVAGTRREDAVKAALAGVDQLMVEIRQAHAAVEARNAVSATWQTTASR